MRHLATAALLFAGLVHLLPVVGILGPPRLAALYGLDATEPNLDILLRHRAVLFGLLGALLVHAAFNRQFATVAVVAGMVSAGSFVLLALLVGGYNAHLWRVLVADVLCIAALLLGAAVTHLEKRMA